VGHLSAEAKLALTRAVEAIELASAAEVVIAVRPASTPALAPCALAGAISGLAGLAFLLFSPWPFSHVAIWLDTLFVGLLGAGLCHRWSTLRRWCTPTGLARAAVDQAARAEFVERKISETRERSGILVYVSQTERIARVLPDRGVLACVPEQSWRAAVDAIARSVESGDDGLLLAQAVTALGPLLSRALPRRADDVNELEDAP
jgi:putative membrane protein